MLVVCVFLKFSKLGMASERVEFSSRAYPFVRSKTTSLRPDLPAGRAQRAAPGEIFITVRNPLGAKGVGEGGTVASTPTVVNVILDAFRCLGRLGPRNAVGQSAATRCMCPATTRTL